MLIVDLENAIRWVKKRGMRLGGGRIYTLSYADDMVLLVEKEGKMRSMMERLEEYLVEKDLELNTEKIIRCRRDAGRMEKRIWR